MRAVRRLLFVLFALAVLLALSLLTSLFGPGPGPDPAGRLAGPTGGPPPPGSRVAAVGPGIRVQAVVRPDGTFHFPGGSKGAVELEVVAGSISMRRPLGGDPAEIRLPAEVDVAGRVIDDETGAPVPGAEVRAGERFGTTGERGTFELPGVPAPEGRLPEIRVVAEGYRPLFVPTRAARAWDDLFLRLVRR